MPRSRRVMLGIVTGLGAVVLLGALLGGCTSSEKRPADTQPEGPRYLRFKLTERSATPNGSWAGTSTAHGWIDLVDGRVRVSTYSVRPRIWTERYSDRHVTQWYIVDRRGRGVGQDSDAEDLPLPSGYIRPYSERELVAPGSSRHTIDGTETVRVPLANAGEPGWQFADVRANDRMPVRMVLMYPQSTTTYTIEASVVNQSAVPATAFALEFPDKFEPQLTRRLDATQAAVFGQYEIYWLGDTYDGLTRDAHFYRASRMQGSPHGRYSPDAWPFWAYSHFAKESVSTAYWKGGDDSEVETTTSSGGVGWFRVPVPGIRVSSSAVRNVKSYLQLKGDPGGVKRRLRRALDGRKTVTITDGSYGSDPRRVIVARRIGDTLVFIEAEPGIAARAIRDVRLFAR